MGWLRLVGFLKFLVSFAKEPYKKDDILQKRPIILRSLLPVATPYSLLDCAPYRTLLNISCGVSVCVCEHAYVCVRVLFVRERDSECVRVCVCACVRVSVCRCVCVCVYMCNNTKT